MKNTIKKITTQREKYCYKIKNDYLYKKRNHEDP